MGRGRPRPPHDARVVRARRRRPGAARPRGRARGALAAHLRAGDRRKLGAVLADLARDDRILAAAACDDDFRTRRADRRAADAASLRGAARPVAASRGRPRDGRGGGRRARARAVVRVADEDGPAGLAVVVHDLSFVPRREAAMRRFTLAAFAVVAVLASILTVVVRRASWRSWTEELRRLLPLPVAGDRPAPRAARSSSRCSPTCGSSSRSSRRSRPERRGGKWSPDAAPPHCSPTCSAGESVVIVANREPYVHERAPDGAVRVRPPGERPRHRARAGDARVRRRVGRARQRLGRPRRGRRARPRPRAARRGVLRAPARVAHRGGGARLLLRLRERGALAALPHRPHAARLPRRGLAPVRARQPRASPTRSARR